MIGMSDATTLVAILPFSLKPPVRSAESTRSVVDTVPALCTIMCMAPAGALTYQRPTGQIGTNMTNNEFTSRYLPAFNFKSEINRDLLIFAINAMVTGPSWSGAGINLSKVVTSIVEETPGSHVTLRVSVCMNADHSNGGSWTDWLITVPTIAGLQNVGVRLDPEEESENVVLHWTEIGAYMLDFEFNWRRQPEFMDESDPVEDLDKSGDDPACDVEGCS